MSKHHLSIVFLLLALMAISLPAHAGEMTGRYLYTLSDFSGPESLSWVRVHTVKYEIFVLNPSDQSIHIFDNNGMEVFQFTVDPTLGPVTDVGATDSGDILLLTGGNGRFSVVRCNYRGEAQATLQLMRRIASSRPLDQLGPSGYGHCASHEPSDERKPSRYRLSRVSANAWARATRCRCRLGSQRYLISPTDSRAWRSIDGPKLIGANTPVSGSRFHS